MQEIIDYLYYSLASGKHLVFLYLMLSISIGLPSLVVLILAYLKSRWKALTYMIYFLAAYTCELIFISYLEYQLVNALFMYNNFESVLFYALESLVILLLPPLVNEFYAVTHRRLINYVFSVLFGIGLILITGPYFIGIYGNLPAFYREGISVASSTNFRIYRFLFWSPYLYAFLLMILKSKSVPDPKERNFYICFILIQLVVVIPTFIPVAIVFPENVIFIALGYFFLNVIQLKYVANRFFEFSQPPLKEPFDELITNREREILVLLVQGLANKEIVSKLCISEATVKTHVQNIYKKLGVNNRVQLINSLKNYLDLGNS